MPGARLAAGRRGMVMKKVLVLGACGNVGPYVTPLLERHYELHLADVRPHPDGRPVAHVDISSYGEVAAALAGMDAAINLTVVRDHPVRSFAVNTLGMYHLMRAAREHGIRRVVHTAAQSARYWFDYDFDVDDIPEMPGTGYYMLTKYLSQEIGRVYARAYGIQVVCFLFNGLGPSPSGPVSREDFPPFTVVWEDLAQACRLALEAESVPDGFQSINLLSYVGHGKYSVGKAHRVLGYQPQRRWEELFTRVQRTG
jgi:nucleoside-diphosphate-sugar epimerase